MHILYIDDSGSVHDAGQRHLVLGGVAVFERGIYHLMHAADACVTGFGLGEGRDIELHASPMYSGRGSPWSQIRSRDQREALIHSALALLTPPAPAVRLFAVVIDKQAVSPRDPMELAFLQLCDRFNAYLRRVRNRGQGDQRGLIVMDQGKHQEPLQALANTVRIDGGPWGHFRHLAEVPLFVDSRATRLVQLADLVAWATWRRYEHQDGRFFEPLLPRFDAEGGVMHGLVHIRGDAREACYCPACLTRQRPAA